MKYTMDKELFNLKFAGKQMERFAKRCLKEEVKSKNMLKAAIKKGDHDNARIHAENAIRHKHTATNYIKLAARIDAVVSRVQAAITSKCFTDSIRTVVVCMENASRSMDMEKVSSLMDKFEMEFDNVEIKSKLMSSSLASTMSNSTPENEVQSLINQVADETGIELNYELPGSVTNSATVPTISAEEEDDLYQRLAKLRHS
ncbi:Charged multivesicular body protein 1b [Schistosoma japonicum]|nr:Charged multivesicular body protein 1b [Schistosoma japonicum]